MIYLVRHGEAAAGWGDHPDPGLSALGKAQAEAVSERLAALGAKRPISSPMLRCQETSIPFADSLRVKPSLEQAVSEIVTPDSVEDRVTWLRDLMSGTWPEAMQSGWCRSAFEAVNALSDGTAVFSHFVAINAIVGQVTGKSDVLVFKPGHCSVTILERDHAGTLQVKQLGDEAATRVL